MNSSTNDFFPDRQRRGLCIWPDVFHNPDLVKSSSHKELLAAGLCAWANVELGHKPPENFGEVYVLIAEEIGMWPAAFR